MQYMEFYAVRHDTGAVLANATLQAFLAGGSAPVTLYDEAGQAQGTQVSADALGRLGVALPFGAYDLQISSVAYTPPKISGLSFGDPMSAGLFTALSGVSVPAGVSLIQTTGYARTGLGSARYAVSANAGATPWRVQTADGRWFELAEPAPDVAMFGAIGDGAADDTSALNANIAYLSEPANSASASAHGGGVVRLRRNAVLRITSPIYLNPFVVIEGDLGAGGFFEDFAGGEASGSGLRVDFDLPAGGAIEAVGFVAATGQRIAPTTYIRGADVDAGTYTNLTGCGLRNLFVYTARATAFCPIRFVGAPQWVLDNVTVQGFWHGPIANASWVGRVPSLFSRCLYSGLILDQDSNGCSLGALYLSGDLAGPPATPVPPACAFPNWPTFGLTDPNSQPPNANLSRTGLCVFAGDPAAASTLVLEGWNVAANVYSSGLSAGVLECESISDHALSVYASRVQVDNLFAYMPGSPLVYAGVGADVSLGAPEWTSADFSAPLAFWSPYADSFAFNGVRSAAYPYANGVVTYPAFELQPYNDLYIDAVAGNDTVIGCAAGAPLKTINQALLRLRPDKLNRVFFAEGQTHLTGAATILETLTVTDCRLELHGFAPGGAAGARPVLECSVDAGDVHTNGLILTRSSLLFQDVDLNVRMCTGVAEGYNAAFYVQGTCDIRFAGASRVQVESGPVQVGLFQPWYGRPGVLTWSLEDTAVVARYPGAAAAGCLGVSAYAGMGRLDVTGGVESSASPAIDTGILANGYVGLSYARVNQAGLNGDWMTWTPTVVATTGALGGYTVNSARYSVAGKQLSFQLDVTVTNAGTASGGLTVQMPLAAKPYNYCAVGAVIAGAIANVRGVINGGSTLTLNNLNGAFNGQTGNQLVLTGQYETC